MHNKYKKKYKDIIKKAEEFHNHLIKIGENDFANELKCIFADDFKESEEDDDKKVIDVLISLVKCNERSGYYLLNNVSTKSMIKWLEKSKIRCNQDNNISASKNKDLDYFDEHTDEKINNEEKSWTEDDELYLRRLMLYLSCRNNLTDDIKNKYINWLESIKIRSNTI